MSSPFLVSLLLLLPVSSLPEDKIDGKLLIGKWQPEKVPEGVTKVVVEYMKEGKLTVDVEAQGGKQKLEGTYTLEGDKLSVKLENNGNEQIQKRKITKLTDTTLVTINEETKEERKYKRVK
jgi:uncharacterized protein (TIGR03066 family)